MTRKWKPGLKWRSEDEHFNAAVRFIAKADPFKDWREINEAVDEVLPLCPPVPGLPDNKTAWAALMNEYEKRVAMEEMT